MAQSTPSDETSDEQSSVGMLTPPCSGTVMPDSNPESSKPCLGLASDSDSGTINPLYSIYSPSAKQNSEPADILMGMHQRLNRLESENKALRGEIGTLKQRVQHLEVSDRSTAPSLAGSGTPRRALTPLPQFRLNAEAAAFTPKLG